MKKVKIKNIKKLDKKYDRYDLTVSTTNNFYANGILIHNTSCIIGNVLVNKPRFGGVYEKVFNYLPSFLQFTKRGYDNIYSSRTVIKNQDYNPKVKDGYYSVDVWNEYYQLLKDKLDEGVTIYGEIFGYISGTQTFIQKGYDYGCKEGENKLMIYRVVKDGVELNVKDVYDFTIELISKLDADSKYKIHPIDILYNGKSSELFNIDRNDRDWSKNFVNELKTKSDWFMEKNEPLCKNKVPREGIVLRIDDDPMKEAFKLKCVKFLSKEAEAMDKGVVEDIEMIEKY